MEGSLWRGKNICEDRNKVGGGRNRRRLAIVEEDCSFLVRSGAQLIQSTQISVPSFLSLLLVNEIHDIISSTHDDSAASFPMRASRSSTPAPKRNAPTIDPTSRDRTSNPRLDDVALEVPNHPLR